MVRHDQKVIFSMNSEELELKTFRHLVAHFRGRLAPQTQELTPSERAKIQVRLGVTLGALGELESGTGSFEEAIAAFQAALREYTCE